MRWRDSLFVLAAGVSAAAQAFTVDARALARFDTSYVRCEAKYPDMRGHQDEAYLGLWKLKADAGGRAQLAKARQATAYRTEQQRARRAAGAASQPMPAKLDHECQALWNETQKTLGATR
jgi:hypothetical protein